jgi:hypothetical protein
LAVPNWYREKSRYWFPQWLTVQILDPSPLLNSTDYGDSTPIGWSPLEGVNHRCKSSEEAGSSDVIARSLEWLAQILMRSHGSTKRCVTFERGDSVWTSWSLISVSINLKTNLCNLLHQGILLKHNEWSKLSIHLSANLEKNQTLVFTPENSRN